MSNTIYCEMVFKKEEDLETMKKYLTDKNQEFDIITHGVSLSYRSGCNPFKDLTEEMTENASATFFDDVGNPITLLIGNDLMFEEVYKDFCDFSHWKDKTGEKYSEENINSLVSDFLGFEHKIAVHRIVKA